MKRAPRPVDREIARFREIVADTNDALLLAEGSAHPDAALLDLCAEALHLLTHAARTRAAGRALLCADAEHQGRGGRSPADALGELLRQAHARAEWGGLFDGAR